MRITFDALFYYAREQYGIGWNPCNDIFFGGVLDYGSFNEYDRYCLIDQFDIEVGTKIDGALIKELYNNNPRNGKIGYMITYNFMIDNKIDDLFIDNK